MATELDHNQHMAAGSTEPAIIASVARALLALEWLAGQSASVGVRDLADHLAINRGTAYKILITLERLGYVRQLPTDEYELTLRLNIVAANNRRVSDIVTMAQPLLDELAQSTRETIQLATLSDSSMVFVARSEGLERLKVGASLGDRVIPHCMSSGKLWLGAQDDEGIRRTLNDLGPLRAYTEHTITDIDSIITECRQAGRNGFAKVNEEFLAGVSSMGCPLYSHGQFVGALTVTGPSIRLTAARMSELLPLIKSVATQLSALWIYR